MEIRITFKNTQRHVPLTNVLSLLACTIGFIQMSLIYDDNPACTPSHPPTSMPVCLHDDKTHPNKHYSRLQSLALVVWTPRPVREEDDQSSFIKSAARSAIITVGAHVCAATNLGITLASMTRRRSIPCTFSRLSTTVVGSDAGPI